MHRKCTQGFRKLIVWQEAKKLTIKIYKLTARFLKAELFGLVSQMQRASASIMANIAEGSAMPTKAHRDAYYARSKGSVSEVDSYADLCRDLGYTTEEEYGDLVDHCARLQHLLVRLIGVQ